ncbi:hypothetical protein D7Z54_17070 [Salibacterium salarium]|uniref:Uncharacterized protein n=1 Tax=Salibacterium salarium TaxID=284579 RepID=A0A3R9P3N5_9BACI|nr:hypothetical protein D7Z54_17070 [Salibacterium salarium]
MDVSESGGKKEGRTFVPLFQLKQALSRGPRTCVPLFAAIKVIFPVFKANSVLDVREMIKINERGRNKVSPVRKIERWALEV